MPETESIRHRIAQEPSAPDAALAWRSLVGQIGAEIAGPLSAAMERIHILTGTGRIDRRGLRALRSEVDAARQVGLVSQQIARLASGEVSQSVERLQLAPILKGVLTQRSRDIESRNVQVRPSLQPVDVVADAPLLFSLLNTLLDWSLANARSHIELRTDIKSWPAHPRLTAHFAHASMGNGATTATASGLDSLIWRLLQQTASSMGVLATRHVDETYTELVLEFTQMLDEPPLEVAGALAVAPAPSPPASALKPLIGSHVLVASAQREVRLQIREAMKNMGLIIDFVDSMEEAADFCKDGLPHALVFEAGLKGSTFDRLRSELLVEAPDFVFVEIVRKATAKSDVGKAGHYAQVPEDAIAATLPATLVAELSKAM